MNPLNHLTDINIYVTGGTIMKVYDPIAGGVINTTWDASRLCNYLSDVARVTNPPIYITSLFSKDSNDISDMDIEKLLNALNNSTKSVNLVLIGTDRMSHIAKLIGDLQDKTVVFVGAMIPLALPNSDGEFNLGFALGCANYLAPGTYIAMNGQVFHHSNVIKNRDRAVFELEDRQV